MSYFTTKELECRHCGKEQFDADALATLNAIREECGFPFIVTSAYRCPEHPIESRKATPGEHSKNGKAIDIAVHSEQAYALVMVALAHGVKRIGVNQKGAKKNRFIHLGFDDEFPNPRIWNYS